MAAPTPPALTPARNATLTALMDDLVPGDGPTPGAGGAGGADYVGMLLSAFDHDPPRIWAGGPFSGRHGGAAGFDDFLELSPWEALAWHTRIEGWASDYAAGLAGLGDDYPDLDDAARAERREAADPAFVDLVFTHGCESLYGDPVYGGNRNGAAWAAIDYRGDVQPAGYTDTEVANPGAGR